MTTILTPEQLRQAADLLGHVPAGEDGLIGRRELSTLMDGLRAMAWSEQTAVQHLRGLHMMIYPERYPRELQPDHIYWEDREQGGEDDPFEWSADTIEWVAEGLERALRDDPQTVKP